MLKGKNIFIISPQKWSGLKVSKHHYAEELARKGNNIFFLNPISVQAGFEIEYSDVAENKNIRLVTIKVPAPYVIKFKVRWLYKKLLKFQIGRVVGNLPKIDIVWDFDGTDMFEDYSMFKSKVNILHPVDNGSAESFCKRTDAHIGFSLAPIIIDKIEKQGIPAYFINHGVNRSIVEQINTGNSLSHISTYNHIKVGYIGNLLIPSLDHEIFSRIISENATVEFHMIGPFQQKTNNITDNRRLSKTMIEWVEFLKNNENVKLYGRKSPSEFLEIVKDFDAFMLCYSLQKDINAGQNSHKILEYLSTGKVIVSNYVIVYDDEKYKDLIVMASKEEPTEEIELFKNTIKQLEYYNSIELQEKRKIIALENSYEKQISRIEKILIEKKIV